MSGEENPQLWIMPGGDTARRMGLAKSAFTPRIYRGLPIDYYMPLINNTYQSLRILLSHEPYSIAPKLYHLHDASLMYYQQLEHVIPSLRKPEKPSLWQAAVRRAVETSEFIRLNRLTAGSAELAPLAAARFIEVIVRRARDTIRKHSHRLSLSPAAVLAQNEEQLMQELRSDMSEEQAAAAVKEIAEAAKAAAPTAVEEALKAAKEYKELKEDAEAAAQLLVGGSGYTHEALSVISFLRDPDEVRRRVRLLREAWRFTQRFTRLIPTSLNHQQMVSLHGGVSGVERMSREQQMRDILPAELASLAAADPRLRERLRLDFLLRLSQKQVLVYQRAASLVPVVFVDKSGSMAEDFEEGQGVPKISVAAGLALALHLRLGGEVYLFDTEVEGPVPRAKVVDTLMRISADGGTQIAEVLRKIAEIGKRDYLYIIISDGMDDPNREAIDAAKKLRDRIHFLLTPPCWTSRWLGEFSWVKAHDVASFESAARRILGGGNA